MLELISTVFTVRSGLLLLGTVIAVLASQVIYNLFFHPLRKYPGPKLAAVSEVWFARAWTGGKLAHVLQETHQKYGPVVRIAPNDLNFISEKAFHDIHGHVSTKSPAVFCKSQMYDSFDPVPAFATMRDPKKHAEGRRKFAHAFSATSLAKQSQYIVKYIDMFMDQVARHGQKEEGIEIVKWLNWLTFDIVGDLTFGESFGAVENAKTSPVVERILNIFFAGSLGEVFRRIPLMKLLAPFMKTVRKLLKDHHDHLEFAHQQVKARIARGNDRDDFFGNIIKDGATGRDELWLRSEAEILLAAGTDTTATAMATMTYYLLQRPETLKNLQKEVRGAFTHRDEINANTVLDLVYLDAALDEALRLTPPLPINLPRTSPGANVDGEFIPKGVTVSTHMWTTFRLPEYFTDPDEFHPERHLPATHPLYDQRYAGDNLGVFKPFLAGRHTCAGINLAKLEIRMVMTRLVLLFDWEATAKLGPGEEIDWKRDLGSNFMWSKPDFKVRFIPRA